MKGLQNHVNFEPVKSLSSKYQTWRFQAEVAKEKFTRTPHDERQEISF